MPQFQNLMEVLKLLEKSNSRKCNGKTCMAFAAAVFKGDRQLSEYPSIAPDIVEQYGLQGKKTTSFEQDFEKQINKFKQKLAAIDLEATARRIGATYDGAQLTLKIMGKDFRVDTSGNLYTDIHVNPWVTIPILSYIIHCKGLPVTGNWVPLRELPGGRDWHRFFSQQCENPLKKIADDYTELFEDLIHIFNATKAGEHYQSDVAVVLCPLPLVPLLICYWKPEDGMESSLSLFFDAGGEENLGIEGLYALGTGIVRMFSKLAQRHRFISKAKI
jgi:hypothetical protein